MLKRIPLGDNQHNKLLIRLSLINRKQQENVLQPLYGINIEVK